MASKKPKPKRGRPARAEAHYRRIAGDLRARLLAGEWAAGEALPSLRRLAERYSAGVNTVRLAVEELRREGRIGTSARRRLVARAPEGPWTVADGVILLVLAGRLDGMLRARYTPELIRGILTGAGSSGAPVLTLHDRHLRRHLPTDALELPLRGIILAGSFESKLLARYQQLGVPVVLADRPGERWKLHSVSADNVAAAREATARLVALGHRRIAFVRFVKLGVHGVGPDSAEREKGFLAAIREAGLPPKAGQVFNAFSSDTPESPPVQALFTTSPPFTAVLAASGGRAQVVAEAAGAAGLRVPGGLSVACFQGTVAAYPRFSGPRIDFEEMGRRAARLLDGPKNPPRHARVAAEWTDGETVAPPRS